MGEDMLLQLEDIHDRDAAELMRGEVLFTRTDDLPPLPPGVYYFHQIEGLEVVTETGEILGRVKEILKTGANDVYVVQGPKGEVLLPAIPQVILEVRLGGREDHRPSIGRVDIDQDRRGLEDRVGLLARNHEFHPLPSG